MKPPAPTAWENGPTGGASSGEVIAVLLMENSCEYQVRWSGRWSRRWAALPSRRSIHKSTDSSLFMTENRQFDHFIILTMILTAAHDVCLAAAPAVENGAW